MRFDLEIAPIGGFFRACPDNRRCLGERQRLINLDKELARNVPVSIETGLFRNNHL
jgi:hypothetical protein